MEAVEEVGISTGRPEVGRDKFKIKSGELGKQEMGESATLEAWLTYYARSSAEFTPSRDT